MREKYPKDEPNRGESGESTPEGPGEDVLDTSPYDASPYDAGGATPADPSGTSDLDPGYGAAPTPGSAAAYGGEEPPGDEPPQGPRRRRRWLWPVIIAVLVLLAAGAVAYLLLDRDGSGDGYAEPMSSPTSDATPSPEEESTAPDADPEATEPEDSPAPEESPEEEPTGPGGELFDQLEESITAGETTFEVTEDGFTPDEDALDAGALEAYAATYEADDVEIDFLATRWADNDLADEYAETLAEALDGAEQVETGSTYIDESGTYWAYVLPDDRGAIIWTTDRGHVFQIVSGIDYVGPFYSAYPL